MNFELITTTFLDNKKKTDRQIINFNKDDGQENEAINIYPKTAYQTFDGFGGAFTDSAAYVFSLMSKEDQDQLLEKYYGKTGIGYTIGRIHLDSCDFSIDQYEAMSDENDSQLSAFSIERTEKYIVPMIARAQEIYGAPIEFMAAPWSPPAFMKTNGQRSFGGSLKKEYYELWAKYICKYIIELKKAGVLINKITIQNEQNAIQTWDSCLYSASEEKDFIENYMYPELIKNNLNDVKIYIWDHNKERIFERTQGLMDETTKTMIAGVAFHWYSGDHFENVKLVNDLYPSLELIQTEACIEHSKHDKFEPLKNAQKYAHNIIGDCNSGMTSFYDWNLLLDQDGGPNHVGNFCDSPFMYDTETKELNEQISFSYLEHFSKYITPGAKRIAFSKYTSDLEMTAFKIDENTCVAVFLNKNKVDLNCYLRLNEMIAQFNLPQESISTAVIKY